ncbi:hypothetical protein DLJ59_15900 [Micromonospora inaquosa]|uniref:Uncharacterized protein n=1 Tax=Micromonospora inaquosa TaxID=2203716 RepID=A0A3N9WN90_9ACTN|nr:hypothetical protein DLJ59_15900 [Micromonospora inaquosa]
MHRVLARITRLLQQHDTTIPPATQPPAALATLRDRVEARSTPPSEPNRRVNLRQRVCGSNGVSGLTCRALCLVRRVP